MIRMRTTRACNSGNSANSCYGGFCSASTRRTMPRFPARIEHLEQRYMLAGPDLLSEQLIGPLPDVTSVVLTFSGPLDPTSAQNKAAYLLFRNEKDGSSIKAFGQTFGNVSIVRRIVPFSSAVYDDAAHTVTLTPKNPFKAGAEFRILRLQGKGANALRNPDGTPIGPDIVRRF